MPVGPYPHVFKILLLQDGHALLQLSNVRLGWKFLGVRPRIKGLELDDYALVIIDQDAVRCGRQLPFHVLYGYLAFARQGQGSVGLYQHLLQVLLSVLTTTGEAPVLLRRLILGVVAIPDLADAGGILRCIQELCPIMGKHYLVEVSAYYHQVLNRYIHVSLLS